MELSVSTGLFLQFARRKLKDGESREKIVDSVRSRLAASSTVIPAPLARLMKQQSSMPAAASESGDISAALAVAPAVAAGTAAE
jgi:hypothetical protein